MLFSRESSLDEVINLLPKAMVAAIKDCSLSIVWGEDCSINYNQKTIWVNPRMLKRLAKKFNLSLAHTATYVIAHEMGHYFLFLSNENFVDEELAWETGLTYLSHFKYEIAPQLEELKQFCLNSYYSQYSSYQEYKSAVYKQWKNN